MIATGTYKTVSGVNGTEVGGLEGAKERIKAFGQDLKERLYVDKIKNLIRKKKTENTTTADGLGEVTYFNPNNALDVGSLEDIEKEIQRHAEQFDNKQFKGNSDKEDYLSGAEDGMIY